MDRDKQAWINAVTEKHFHPGERVKAGQVLGTGCQAVLNKCLNGPCALKPGCADRKRAVTACQPFMKKCLSSHEDFCARKCGQRDGVFDTHHKSAEEVEAIDPAMCISTCQAAMCSKYREFTDCKEDALRSMTEECVVNKCAETLIACVKKKMK